MTNSWSIPSFRVEELKRRVEVLNRRVTRTGGQGLSLKVVSELRRAGTTSVQEEMERWSEIVVAGDVPRVDGWQFVARVEHHETGNIVSVAPGSLVDLPSTLRLAGASCSHCQAARNRKDTFVLYKDGEMRQVGRNCLADFLRSGDPEVALRVWSVYASMRSLLNEAAERGYGPSDPRGFSTVYFLACTVAAIREGGWISKAVASQVGRTPTADIASFIASSKPKGRTPVAEDFAEAGEVAAWIEDLAGREDLNDYLSNLRAAVAVGCVERRHEGIVASGVAAYRRDLEKAAELAANAAREAVRPSSHVGQVDKRYDFRGLVVRSARTVTNDWGSSLMLLLEDQDGNDLKCFLRGVSFEVGDVLGGKATVKGHSEFKGRKVTDLTRCKLETGLPVQGTLPVPKVSAAPKSAPEFTDDQIPF
jgi:hypothetical protein